MKALKLALAALLTFACLLTGFYLVDRERFYYNYRCWQRAVALTSCVRSGDFDFEVDLNGARYQGNTGNYIDTHILYYGAYEKPALGLRRTQQIHRPIVQFELTADPKKGLSIKSIDELVALFPQGYEFLVFSDKDKIAASTGAYFLEPAARALRFDAALQYDVVAYR